MSRTRFLSAVAVVLLAILFAESAAAASTGPRGVLTHAEYQELLATQNALGNTDTPTRACRALTDLSRLTETQRSQCLEVLPFYSALENFTDNIKHCQKSANPATAYRCIYGIVDVFYQDTAAFIDTNKAATAAVTQRGLTGKCFDDLVFTPDQTRAMIRLADGLHTYAQDLLHINVTALRTDAKPVDADFASASKAMLVTSTVTVCPHQ